MNKEPEMNTAQNNMFVPPPQNASNTVSIDQQLVVQFSTKKLFIEQKLQNGDVGDLDQVMGIVELTLNAMGFGVKLFAEEDGAYIFQPETPVVELEDDFFDFDDLVDEPAEVALDDIVLPLEVDDVVEVLVDEGNKGRRGFIEEDDGSEALPYKVRYFDVRLGEDDDTNFDYYDREELKLIAIG
jgi:hypothetical protein